MFRPRSRDLMLAGMALAVASCAPTKPTPPQPLGRIDQAAATALKASADKLEAARTLRVSATHKLDPALGLGTALDEGTIELTVQRPNKFHAIQPVGVETREIAWDGRQLCVMHPELKHHALESVRASSIEQFALLVDQRFGFRPPVAELLANDMEKEVMHDVTSAQIVGTESVRGTRCQRLHLWQKGMTTDLWIGEADQLPHRMYLTFTGLAGQPGWDITFTSWELNPAVDAALFSKRPATDSVKVKMLKSH